MLIQLTRKCNEGCSHCMVNAVPNGETMNWDILKRVVEYLKLVKPPFLIISGGEFTLAEEWFEKCFYIIDNLDCHFMLQSNGWWMREDFDTEEENLHAAEVKLDLQEFIECKKVLGINISSSKRFYPNYDKIVALKPKFDAIKKVSFYTDWQGEGYDPLNVKKENNSNLINLGRATQYFKNGEIPAGQPGCLSLLIRARSFNKTVLDQLSKIPTFKNITKNSSEFTKFVYTLAKDGKVCKPMINFNGDIHIGETQYCVKFDSVNNYFDELGKRFNQIKCYGLLDDKFNNLKSLKICDRCKSKQNLPLEFIIQQKL